jgi:hypothetical protein
VAISGDNYEDKAQMNSRKNIGQVIGRLRNEDLVAVNRALVVFPGFAGVGSDFFSKGVHAGCKRRNNIFG